MSYPDPESVVGRVSAQRERLTAPPGFTCRRGSTIDTLTRLISWGVGKQISPERSGWSRLPLPILVPVRTGILGGTFDPIHIAHLHAGETALHQAALDRVLFLPAGRPWQKEGSDVMAAEHRLAMTHLAVEGIPQFEVDDQEVLRDGPTFTADTLATFGDDEELFLVLGADAAMGMATWDRHEEVLKRVTVLVVARPGTDSTSVLEVIPDAIFLDMAVLEVSGTDIRNMARDSQPFRFLVTREVHQYIHDNDLYPDRRERDRVEPSPDMEEPS